MTNRPLCFVLMPFGKKAIPSRRTVDFDAVYHDIIQPAIDQAGLEPLRADEELVGGVIHKPMYERLMLCDYAVADLTGANANVFYELGLRHGIRPATTVLLSGETGKLPFDVGPLRTLPYTLGGTGKPTGARDSVASLKKLLDEAQRHKGEPPVDSPVFQLLENFPRPDIARLRTDTFRRQAVYAERTRSRLATARRGGPQAVASVARSLGRVDRLEAGVVVDLYLSHRAVENWPAMVDLCAAMPEPLKRTRMVQEQLGFALNRLGRRADAEAVLLAAIATFGPSSETNGLLGRVYKDRWEDEIAAGSSRREARSWLNKAIDTYLAGFDTDWRDAYPGVNAVTLMTIANPYDERLGELLTVVNYAVKRRLAHASPDYWDHATRLELAVLGADERAAEDAATDALAAIREVWEPKTTAKNLRFIREARAGSDQVLPWAEDIERDLVTAAARRADKADQPPSRKAAKPRTASKSTRGAKPPRAAPSRKAARPPR
jgi:hypothetical protein